MGFFENKQPRFQKVRPTLVVRLKNTEDIDYKQV